MAESFDDADALVEQARTACRAGRLVEGIDLARRALSIDPRKALAHNLLGMALNALERREEALASFDSAIACAPALAEAHGNRGDVLLDLGRTAEAVQSYDLALAVAPDSVETWFNRGAALQALRRDHEAAELFRTGTPDQTGLLGSALRPRLSPDGARSACGGCW